MVERGSVQHGARLDDEMAEEVAPLTHGAPLENHAREDLEAEPPADGEPTPDSLVSAGPDRGHVGLSHDDVELRSEIARHLRLSAFPAHRDELLLVADEEGASDDVLSLLASLPRDVEFHQISDVWRALGGEVEHREEASDVATSAPTEDDMTPVVIEEDAVDVEIEIVVVPDDDLPDEVVVAEPDEIVTADSPAAPGCNLFAIAAHAAADAGGALARIARHALPFS